MTNFVYDPKRQGYDTNLFKTLVGVPAVVGNHVILNATEIVGYADMYGCDLTMRLIIPAAPKAGDVRQFGLASAAFGSLIVFDITDAVFSILATNEQGDTKSEVVTFDAAWAATPVDFEIRWRGTYADFLIRGINVVTPANVYGATYRITDVAIPKGPLSMYFLNGVADNMEIVSINGKNIQTFI